MSSKDVLELSLDRDVVNIRLCGKDKKVKEFVLTELDGIARDDYLTEMGKKMKTVNGVTEIKDYKGLQAMLICKCMSDKFGEPLSVDDCQALPGKTITKLFEECQTLNGLGDIAKAKEKAKND